MKQSTVKTATVTEKKTSKEPKGTQEAPKPVLETITPEIAQKYLESNPNNRPVHFPTVKTYAKAMLDGEWRPTHQTIAFDNEGHLQDGQHRLLAVIESQTTQQFWVFRDMPVTNFTVIDVGRDRKTSDVLALADMKEPNLKASISKFVLAYESGSKANAIAASTGSSGKNFISNDKVLQFAKAHRRKLDRVAELSKAWFEKFPKALEMRFIGGLYWFISEINDELGQEFFDSLTTGAGLKENSPILKFRNILINNLTSKKRLPRSEKFALAVKAWNLYISGREVNKLSFNRRSGEKFPEIQKQVLLQNSDNVQTATA